MKALVDPQTNTIHGIYQEPITFSISGHYIIDIPTFISSVIPTSDSSITDLIANKLIVWKSFSTVVGGTAVYDELITNPNVDTVNSTGVILGPNKRTIILAGGTLLTNPISISAASSHTFFLHYFGFHSHFTSISLSNPTSATPGPGQILYSYNPNTLQFETFANS